jgi:hypothetical protein
VSVAKSIRSCMKTGLVLALSLVLMSSPVAVAAEKRDSLTLSPASKRLQLEAGGVVNDSFVVINDGDTSYDFTVYTAPYSVKGEDYEQDFTTQTENSDAYKWISFAQSKWHAEPGDNVTIPFTVRVGAGVPAGGHYGTIFVETIVTEAGDQTGIARKKRLGIILYTNVKGETESGGQVKSVSLDFFQPASPMKSDVSIENTGKTDFTATSRMVVKDIFGQQKFSTSSENIILPKTTRHIEHSWNNSPWLGIFRVTVTNEVLGKTTTTESLVLVVPRWLLLVIGVLALVGVANALRKKRAHTPRRRI